MNSDSLICATFGIALLAEATERSLSRVYRWGDNPGRANLSSPAKVRSTSRQITFPRPHRSGSENFLTSECRFRRL